PCCSWRCCSPCLPCCCWRCCSPCFPCCCWRMPFFDRGFSRTKFLSGFAFFAVLESLAAFDCVPGPRLREIASLGFCRLYPAASTTLEGRASRDRLTEGL